MQSTEHVVHTSHPCSHWSIVLKFINFHPQDSVVSDKRVTRSQLFFSECFSSGRGFSCFFKDQRKARALNMSDGVAFKQKANLIIHPVHGRLIIVIYMRERHYSEILKLIAHRNVPRCVSKYGCKLERSFGRGRNWCSTHFSELKCKGGMFRQQFARIIVLRRCWHWNNGQSGGEKRGVVITCHCKLFLAEMTVPLMVCAV